MRGYGRFSVGWKDSGIPWDGDAITPNGQSPNVAPVRAATGPQFTLGTRTQIPTRHMLDTLGVQTTSDSNVPSGYRLDTF